MNQPSIHETGFNASRLRALQGGLTIVELMVALTIGLVILVALGQLFVTSRASYTMEEGLARMQESGRFAMEFLTKDIRMAGYAGCHNPSNGAGTVSGSGGSTACTTSMCSVVTGANEATRFAVEGIRAYTYTGAGTGTDLTDWTPNLPAVFFSNGDVKAQTDVILVQYAQATNARLQGNTPPSNFDIRISDSPALAPAIAQNDILIVSDCRNVDVFRVTNTPVAASGLINIEHDMTGNASTHLTHAYGDDAEIYRLVSRVYYIAPSGSGTEPALMVKEMGSGGLIGPEQELVQGIEDMRARYGVDSDTPRDGVANRYMLANEVLNVAGSGSTWDDVSSIRLGLLVRTPANVDQPRDTKLFEVTDQVFVGPANDNRRRQVYRSTIKVRNNCVNMTSC